MYAYSDDIPNQATPALTPRGMGTEALRRIAGLIDRALARPQDDVLDDIRREVEELTAAFPLYEGAPRRGRK